MNKEDTKTCSFLSVLCFLSVSPSSVYSILYIEEQPQWMLFTVMPNMSLRGAQGENNRDNIMLLPVLHSFSLSFTHTQIHSSHIFKFNFNCIALSHTKAACIALH